MRKVTFIYNGSEYKDSLFYANGAYPDIHPLNSGIGTKDSLNADRTLLIVRALDQYDKLVDPNEEKPDHQNPARLIDFTFNCTLPIGDNQIFSQDSAASSVSALIALDVPFPNYDSGGSHCYHSKTLKVAFTKVQSNEMHATFSGTFENAFGTTLKVEQGSIDIVK